MKIWPVIAIFTIHLCAYANSTYYEKAYFDQRRQINIIDDTGKRVVLPTHASSRELEISPDKRAVTWVSNKESSDELNIYVNDKKFHIICQSWIRSYWFVRNGKQVAIDCGGIHFAGRETLYDIETQVQIETFDQASVPLDLRPVWSKDN